MQSLSTALASLQPRTPKPEHQTSTSPTLQRGLTRAAGKMTSAELDHARAPYSQPLTREVVSLALLTLRSLNSCRTVEETFTPSTDLRYPSGTYGRRITYNLPDGASPQAYRALLTEMIRPADKRLTMILLSQLMTEKPFFDADQEQVKYRLQQLSSDLADYPYLAIWLGIDDIRTKSERRGFPETAEILRHVRDWMEHITHAFQFFAHTPQKFNQ